MAKWLSDTVLNAACSSINENVNKLIVCRGQPDTVASAIADYGSGGHKLAETALVKASMPIAGGDTSGRKVTIQQQTGITVSVTGTADHCALVEVSAGATALYAVTTATSQTLTSGNTLTVNGWDIEFQDPS